LVLKIPGVARGRKKDENFSQVLLQFADKEDGTNSCRYV
jgi:hypothetical protein